MISLEEKAVRQERILAHRRKSKLVIYSLSYDETGLAKEAWVAGVFCTVWFNYTVDCYLATELMY